MDWEPWIEEAVNLFFLTINDIIDNITLPTGNSLIPTTVFSFAIFVLSLLSRLIFHASFFDWRGALIATILLLIVCIIEGRGKDEISRLRRIVATGASNIKERAAGASAYLTAHRGTASGKEELGQTERPTDGSGKVL